MDDGVLHAVLVKNIGRITFARLFPAYSAGNYRQLPAHLIRVSAVSVVRIRSAGEEFVTCLDGESFRWTEATLKLANKRVHFFGPRGCDPNATAKPAAAPCKR